MKTFAKLSLVLFASTLAFAETTMCFKENHSDMTTIEKVKLSGGECNDQKSVQDMKKEGWSVDDIKITDNNYVYIFKKEAQQTAQIDMDALEAQILQRLEVKKQEAQKEERRERKYAMSISGKKLYIKKCQNCHGDKGEKVFGTSRAINELTLSDFKLTIRDYKTGTYDRGAAFQMRPYANLMTEKDTINVYLYLKALNNPEKGDKPLSE